MKTLLFSFILIATTALAGGPEDLRELILKNPGLATQDNPEILEREAKKHFGEARARELRRFVTGDLAVYQAAKIDARAALASAGVSRRLESIVVSGQSVTGMLAAAIAAKSGHPVRVYDTRMRYTRDIQWSSRQSVSDILSSVDPALAERYNNQVAKDVSRGYLSFGDDGHNTRYPVVAVETPDPRRVPFDTSKMLAADDVATVPTRAFEQLMSDYLDTLPNVTRVRGKVEFGPIDPVTGRHVVTEYEDVTPKGEKTKVYKALRTGQPITIIAEGAGSSNRTSLNIDSVPISPKRLQVAGVVHVENGAEIVTHYRNEATGRLITGSMGTTGTGKRWVVGDIDEARITPDPKKFGVDAATDIYKAEKARLLELEFKRIAALNMRMPFDEVKKMKVSGAIEGLPLQSFELQQRISKNASSGKNVLLLADAVGNGHWSVGGGMHVGAVSHGERLKNFLTHIDGGGALETATKTYARGVLADSMSWGEDGLYYFYNNLSHEEAKKVYREAASLYQKGKVETPERALELMLPGGRASREIKKVNLKCEDIILRILGDV